MTPLPSTHVPKISQEELVEMAKKHLDSLAVFNDLSVTPGRVGEIFTNKFYRHKATEHALFGIYQEPTSPSPPNTPTSPNQHLLSSRLHARLQLFHHTPEGMLTYVTAEPDAVVPLFLWASEAFKKDGRTGLYIRAERGAREVESLENIAGIHAIPAQQPLWFANLNHANLY
jgi:hypothetical protein